MEKKSIIWEYDEELNIKYRRISHSYFVFLEDKNAIHINLETYSLKKIENCLNNKGYTIFYNTYNNNQNLVNITEVFEEDSIFEMAKLLYSYNKLDKLPF